MEQKKNKFSAVGEILKQRVIGGGAAPALSLLDLVNRWPEIVGHRIAEQAGPVRLRHGLLTIQVRSPAWAQELQMMAETLLPKIKQESPQLKIEKLRFIS